ncbi:phosphatase [uncultured Brachyspira sp.]|uniref:phosphatase n=1 Tax=uncultured Brachyspira sp. TaxID=221953 RepID=UPI0025E8E11F|nr:phosphatase [uncultured Brachyspira sp.]
MKIIADLHTHTLVSEHAYSTVDEMVNSAKDKGFLALAITDHGPASSDGAKSVHFKAMHSLPDYINGVRLLKGSEVNIIDYNGKVDLSENVLSYLDFVIASYHEDSIEPITKKEHTKGYAEVIKNPNIDCLGHIGNPKFEFDIEYIVKLCKEYNKLIEINSSSFIIRKGSFTICKDIALTCKKYEANIVVTSDAHSKYKVGCHEDAVELLSSIDFPEHLILNSDYDKLMNYIKKSNIKS